MLDFPSRTITCSGRAVRSGDWANENSEHHRGGHKESRGPATKHVGNGESSRLLVAMIMLGPLPCTRTPTNLHPCFNRYVADRGERVWTAGLGHDGQLLSAGLEGGSKLQKPPT